MDFLFNITWLIKSVLSARGAGARLINSMSGAPVRPDPETNEDPREERLQIKVSLGRTRVN